jgi:peptidyl-dipeptidase Dcp
VTTTITPAAATVVFTKDNPFASPSTLLFGAPPFDRIHDSDYQPAIEEGMRRHLAEVDAIADQAAPPTFDNTIVALEKSGELLTRVLKVFGGVTGANTNDVLQKIQSDEAPKLAAHTDAIFLNDALFRRVQSIYDRREQLGLSAEQRYLVERYHLEFERAGARLSEADKSRLRALNQEESTLTTDFQNKLLAATKAAALVIDDRSRLAGLSEADVAAAAEAAKERGLSGKWVLTTRTTRAATSNALPCSARNARSSSAIRRRRPTCSRIRWRRRRRRPSSC